MKKAVYISGIVIIIILALTLYLWGGRQQKIPGAKEQRQAVLAEAEKTVVTVYYATTDQQALLPLSLEINATTEAARVALEKLLAGPAAEGVVDSIPTDTKLLDIYSAYNTVYVDLSRQFLDIPPRQAQLAADALAATALPLTNCDRLQILVEGAGVAQFGPVDLSGPLSLPRINPFKEAETAAEEQEDAEEPAPQELLFYVPDACGSGFIVPYTASFVPDPATEAPLAMAQAVLGLWDRQGFLAASQVNSLTLNKSLLTLDLPSSLFSAMDEAEQAAFCRSLVYTLCNIPGVDGLNLYLDGAAALQLPGGSALEQPLTITEPVNRI